MRPAISRIACGRALFVKVSIIRFKVQGFVVECRIGNLKKFRGWAEDVQWRLRGKRLEMKRYMTRF